MWRDGSIWDSVGVRCVEGWVIWDSVGVRCVEGWVIWDSVGVRCVEGWVIWDSDVQHVSEFCFCFFNFILGRIVSIELCP